MEDLNPSDAPEQPVPQSGLNEASTRQNPDQGQDQNQDQNQDQESADCCVICLDPISDACETFPCRHRSFDYPCLSSWLERSSRCPLCNTIVTQVHHALDEPNLRVYVVPPRAMVLGPTITLPRLRLQGPNPRSRTWELPSSYVPPPPPPEPVPVSIPPPEADRDETVSAAVARRRDIYRNNRYSKHVGSNRISQYQELTPTVFCANPELVSRARMWIRRELRVFSFLSLNEADTSIDRPSQSRTVSTLRRANNAEFLLEYVICVLKSVDIMGSGGQAESMISDFLGRDNTPLFLHELRNWLRSPYTTLEDWDGAVQYDESPPAGASAGSASGANVPMAAIDEFSRARRRCQSIFRDSSRTLRPCGPELERYLASPAYQQRREERNRAMERRAHRQMVNHLRLAHYRAELHMAGQRSAEQRMAEQPQVRVDRGGEQGEYN